MRLIIRKRDEQQAELLKQVKVNSVPAKTASLIQLLILAAFLVTRTGSAAHADIYRFVTVDGVETFTDAPSDKSATIVIKGHQPASTKQKKTGSKQKIHDISLDEIVQKTVSAQLTPAATDQNSFEPQLPSVGGSITSGVGMRIDPIDGSWRQHNGIDIAIPTGTEVKPVAPGVVVYSGSRSGYGNTVIVEHDNGIVSLYAHNSRILVTQGQIVTPEITLALSGSTGRSTGPHLHFEAWQAGANVTSAFLPNSGMTLTHKSLVADSRKSARFRSETLSDGSILFTNIPSSTP